MKKLLLFLLISYQANAGLPPTSSKGSGDSTNITTFNFQFPNFAITHTGVTASLGVLGVAGGGTGTGTVFTVGSLVFTDGSGIYSQNNSQLFWDNSNFRLGIGTNAPSAPLQINTIESTNVLGPAIDFQSSTSGDVAQIDVAPVSGSAAQLYVNFNNVTSGIGNWLAYRFGGASNKWFFGDDGTHDYFQTGHDMNFATGVSGTPTTSPTNALVLTSTTNRAGIGTSSPSSKIEVDGSAVGTVVAIFKGLASQTADLLEVQNSSGTSLFLVDNLGQFRTTGTTPTIASNACGSSTQGTVTGTNQSGLITVGTALVTVCTISWSTTLGTAPKACLISPANTTAAATGTVAAYISSVSTTNFVITGTALASAAYYFHCY